MKKHKKTLKNKIKEIFFIDNNKLYTMSLSTKNLAKMLKDNILSKASEAETLAIAEQKKYVSTLYKINI